MPKLIDRLIAYIENAAALNNEAAEGTRIIAQRARGMSPENLQELARTQGNINRSLDQIREARQVASQLQKGQSEE